MPGRSLVREWRNWQTRDFEVVMIFSCGFKSHLSHIFTFRAKCLHLERVRFFALSIMKKFCPRPSKTRKENSMKKMSWCAHHLLPKDYISCVPSKNLMRVPRVSHLVFHTSGQEMLRTSLALQMICGQKPVVTRAKHFVAGFKIRRGQILGAKVTLRKMQLFSCLEKFQSIFLPSKRDWVGIRASVSGHHSGLRALGGVNFLFFQECMHQYEIFEGLHGFQVHLIAHSSQHADLIWSSLQYPFFVDQAQGFDQRPH